MQKDLENISARVWKSYAFTGKTCQIGRNTQVSILRKFFLVSSERLSINWRNSHSLFERLASLGMMGNYRFCRWVANFPNKY